ncbi:MAG: hypothetical protein KF894_12635 [Labilithrix sp.]|nr:hypothetical protein [Labilithrix sp.]
MKRILLSLGLVAPVGLLWACTGDDDVFRPTDAGAFEASTSDQASLQPTDGGASALACGDASGVPPRVLLVQGKPAGSELAVVNLTTNAVDGRLPLDGGYGTTAAVGTDPYLLGGESDLVTRLDAREPWRAVATWNVRGNDKPATGLDNANPVGVVQTACDKAYVLRFNRDRIAILDPSRPAGGAPTKYIDLAPLKQAGDPDVVEMTSAVYVPAKKRVYVLLGNADLTRFVTSGGVTKLVCTALKPSIVAIDVDTDEIVSLGGTAPGGGIALEGYNPPLGTPLVYDAAFDRLLVLQAGCNEDLGDGGAGDMTRRRVEQVDLATGAVKTLLPLDDRGFPSSLAFASGEHAAVAFYFDGYRWDPRQTSLGDAIPGGMDLIASDGRGAFVGVRQLYPADGGVGPLQVLTVPTTDAGPSVVTEDPFSSPGGYVAGMEAWPQR